MADTIRSLSSLQGLFANNTTQAISSQDLRDFLVSSHPTNIILSGLYGSRPSVTKGGILYFSSNGPNLNRDTSSIWETYGVLSQLTPPILGDYSWINQSTSTLTQTGNAICLKIPASASINVRALVKTAPATPYTISACFTYLIGIAGSAHLGLCWRQSSDGKLIAVNLNNAQAKFVGKFNSPTSFSANYGTVANLRTNNDLIWMRISDDGTNRKYWLSNDGFTWTQAHTIGRTDFMTADQVGFYANSENSIDLQMTLLSWKEE